MSEGESAAFERLREEASRLPPGDLQKLFVDTLHEYEIVQLTKSHTPYLYATEEGLGHSNFSDFPETIREPLQDLLEIDRHPERIADYDVNDLWYLAEHLGVLNFGDCPASEAIDRALAESDPLDDFPPGKLHVAVRNDLPRIGSRCVAKQVALGGQAALEQLNHESAYNVLLENLLVPINRLLERHPLEGIYPDLSITINLDVLDEEDSDALVGLTPHLAHFNFVGRGNAKLFCREEIFRNLTPQSLNSRLVGLMHEAYCYGYVGENVEEIFNALLDRVKPELRPAIAALEVFSFDNHVQQLSDTADGLELRIMGDINSERIETIRPLFPFLELFTFDSQGQADQEITNEHLNAIFQEREAFEKLYYLYIAFQGYGNPNITDIPPLPPFVRELVIWGCDNVEHLHLDLPLLETLNIGRVARGCSVTGSLPELYHLFIEQASLSTLPPLPKLTQFWGDSNVLSWQERYRLGGMGLMFRGGFRQSR